MDKRTYRTLIEINTRFYSEQAKSFSETRKNPWYGWERCAKHVEKLLAAPHFYLPQEGFNLLDVAAGNMRFEKFLSERFENLKFNFYAVDNADSMVPDLAHLQYQSLDLVSSMLEGNSLTELIEAPSAEVSVSFGFMHHIPSFEHRVELLKTLISKTKPDGLAIVSFWQFLSNPKLRAKALVSHAEGLKKYKLEGLGKDDFLLGWKHDESVFRYCHNFEQDEIDAIIDSVKNSATLIDSFVADGKTNDMNNYAVLRVS